MSDNSKRIDIKKKQNKQQEIAPPILPTPAYDGVLKVYKPNTSLFPHKLTFILADKEGSAIPITLDYMQTKSLINIYIADCGFSYKELTTTGKLIRLTCHSLWFMFDTENAFNNFKQFLLHMENKILSTSTVVTPERCDWERECRHRTIVIDGKIYHFMNNVEPDAQGQIRNVDEDEPTPLP